MLEAEIGLEESFLVLSRFHCAAPRFDEKRRFVFVESDDDGIPGARQMVPPNNRIGHCLELLPRFSAWRPCPALVRHWGLHLQELIASRRTPLELDPETTLPIWPPPEILA